MSKAWNTYQGSRTASRKQLRKIGFLVVYAFGEGLDWRGGTTACAAGDVRGHHTGRDQKCQYF
jgi:hypothetical protein